MQEYFIFSVDKIYISVNLYIKSASEMRAARAKIDHSEKKLCSETLGGTLAKMAVDCLWQPCQVDIRGLDQL